MNTLEIDPVRFDDFVLDCADAAVTLEIQRQQQSKKLKDDANEKQHYHFHPQNQDRLIPTRKKVFYLMQPPHYTSTHLG